MSVTSKDGITQRSNQVAKGKSGRLEGLQRSMAEMREAVHRAKISGYTPGRWTLWNNGEKKKKSCISLAKKYLQM